MTIGLTGIAALEAEMRDRLAEKNATISRLTAERDGLKEMAVNWQTAAVAEMERCTAAERERDGLRKALEEERERCANLAEQEADSAQTQIDVNNEYLRSQGRPLDSSANKLCHSRMFAAKRIADAIRATPTVTDADRGSAA